MSGHRRRGLRALGLLLAGLALFPLACDPEPEPEPAPTPTVVAADRSTVEPIEGLDIRLGAYPERLDADALRRSVQVVTQRDDGTSMATHEATPWLVQTTLPSAKRREEYRVYRPIHNDFDFCVGEDNVNEWACDGFHDKVFGRTLGRPDYDDVPARSVAIDATYVKLTREMAWHVCGTMAESDALRSRPGNNVLTPGFSITEAPPETTKRDNLRELVLRFHGVDRADDDPVIDALDKLYDQVAGASGAEGAGGSTTASSHQQAWAAVCVALFEDPLFHLR